MDCSLSQLNNEVLLHVYSYLSQSFVRMEVANVSEHWREVAKMDYVVVSDSVTENGIRRFSSLQAAVDKCPNDSTIIVRKPIDEKVIIHNKRLYISSQGNDVIVRTLSDCVFDIANSNVRFVDLVLKVQRVDVSSKYLIQSASSTLYLSNVFAHNESEPSYSFLSSSKSNLTLHTVHIDHMYDGIVGCGTLDINNCLFSSIYNDCIHLQEGDLTIKHTIISSDIEKHGYAGITYESSTNRCILDDVILQYFRFGVICRGISILHACTVERCTDVGIWIDNREDPILCEITDCMIKRVREGILAHNTNITIIRSHIQHVVRAIHTTDCLLNRVEKNCLHDCREVGILCRHGRVLIIMDNSIYNCKRGCDLSCVEYLLIVRNVMIYINETILFVNGMIDQLSIYENYVAITSPSTRVQRDIISIQEDHMFISKNRLVSLYPIEKCVFDSADSERYSKLITINPIKREKGLFAPQLVEEYFQMRSLFYPRFLIVPAMVSIALVCVFLSRR